MLLTAIFSSELELEDDDELDERPEDEELVPLDDFDLRVFFFFFLGAGFFFVFLSTEEPELLDEDELLLLLPLPLSLTFFERLDLLELDDDLLPLFLTLRLSPSSAFFFKPFDLELLVGTLHFSIVITAISLHLATAPIQIVDLMRILIILILLTILPSSLHLLDETAEAALFAVFHAIFLR